MKKHLLVIIDRSRWALHRQMLGLMPYLSNTYEMTICTPSTITKVCLDSASVIYLASWNMPRWYPILNEVCDKYAYKMLAGIHSHFSFEQSGSNRTFPNRDVPPDAETVKYLSRFNVLGVISPRLHKLFAGTHEKIFYLKAGVDPHSFYPQRPVNAHRSNLIVGWAGSLLNQPGNRGYEKILQPLQRYLSGNFHFNYCIEHLNGREFDDMTSFYNEIDIYICASRSEGASTPVREALACGRPVLSTNVGDTAQIVTHRHNGWIVDGWSLKAVCEMLCDLNQDRNSVAVAASNARSSILDGWTWEQVAPNWLNAFRAAEV